MTQRFQKTVTPPTNQKSEQRNRSNHKEPENEEGYDDDYQDRHAISISKIRTPQYGVYSKEPRARSLA